MTALPARPSAEHLRKRAKRLAKHQALPLADAQRRIANDCDFRSWADLMTHVALVRGGKPVASVALFAAVRAGKLDLVRALIADGVNPRLGDGHETPLHAAVRHGSVAVVDALIAGGALEWQTDTEGRTPLDVARRSRGKERLAIIAALDRSAVSDPAFRAAIDAIHAGDTTTLAELLDRDPRLLVERVVGPDAYRRRARPDYFADPKLVWFVANNPTLVDVMPSNIDAVASVMLARGVDPDDLNYTLELTMTSSSAREHHLQFRLMHVLVAAGAVPTRQALLAAGAYRECDALRAIVELGYVTNTAIAASLGDAAFLADHLAHATQQAIDDAFALAVINGHERAARTALDAGADINAYFPVHSHETALHQAAGDDNVSMIELLLQRGADARIRDKLWDGTPHDWALHLERAGAAKALG